MSELITRTCIHCGKEIQIPSELMEFSCVYCGEKMSALLFAPPPEDSEAEAADLAYVQAHLVDCISKYPDYFKHFNRKEYPDYFNIYQRNTRDIFEAMDRYIRCNLARREALLAEFATLFLDAREEYHRQDKRWKHKGTRERMLFDSKLVLTWFTVPAIMGLELSIGRDYVLELHRQYMLRYPDNGFLPGTYEEISAGFKKKKYFFF